ncbi:PAS domain-containing protein [Ideonella sp. DXS29W]|uniref:PAS domain-containing protein n=1 Tax=Ideonella lacteola TaxID=2984193 RepID=A0ABU9BPG0_9BURK
MNLTLKFKAALVTTGAVLATVSLAGAWLYRQQARDHVALLRGQQDTLASEVADDLDEQLASILSVLVRAAKRVDADVLAYPEARVRFFELSALKPPFNGAAIVSADGIVVYNDTPNAGPANISDRDYFRQARVTGQPTISLPVKSRANGHPSVLMTVPLFDADHRFIGALVGGLDLVSDNALSQWGRSRVGATGRYEISTRGTTPVYVMHPDPSMLLAPAANPATLDDFDTSRDFITRRSLRSVPWELRVVIPATEAHGPLVRAHRALLWVLVMTGLISAVAVSAGVGRLMRPLERLTLILRQQRAAGAAQAPASKPRPAAVDEGGEGDEGDEWDRLAGAFESLLRDLRVQRAEMAAVYDTSPLGVFRAALDGRLTDVNEAYLRIHGFSHRADAAEGWLSLLPIDRQAEARRAWQKIVTEPVGMHVTRKLHRTDGKPLVLVVRSAPVMIDGRVQGHVGTVADITDRIEGERALRMQAALFEATTDVVVQTDRWGRLIYMNPAARRLAGLAPDAPIQHLKALSLLPPETEARHGVEIVPQALEKGFWAGETLQWDAQRRAMLTHHLLVAHKDRHGQVEAFSAVLRDISVQRAAQQASHRSEALLRALTDAVPMAVLVVDRDGRCVDLNPAFEAWAGTPRDGLLGRLASEVMVPAGPSAPGPNWIERANAGEELTFAPVAAAPGAARWLRLRCLPLQDEQGAADGFVAIAGSIYPVPDDRG